MLRNLINRSCSHALRTIVAIALLASTALQSWADGYTYYYFKGRMGGRVSVEMAFQKFEGDEEGTVAGYIYYPKAKNPAPILIVGNVYNNRYHFDEYQSDGTITGWINLEVNNENAADGPFITEGEWTNPKTGDSFSLTALKTAYDMPRTQMYRPDWWTETPLDYDSPDNIGREYGYQQWNPNYKEMMGGNVTFTAAGKNKVHFYVSNCPGNIAEGGSEKGRPAVLHGPEFTYDNVNECGYGFKATFFKKFVVLETTTDFETTQCFGMGATFAGVYIKTKQ